MATVLYGVCGEGRGHATRARAMVDVLRRDHRVVVLAAGDAYPVLARAFAGNGVRVEAIPGLRFRYNRRGHLAPLATALAAMLYLRRFPQLLARARDLLSEER